MPDVLALASDLSLRSANLSCAAALATRLRASLCALHVVPPCPREYDFAPASVASEVIELCREQWRRATDAADDFAAWTCSHQLASAGWYCSEDETVDAVTAASLWHDFIVVPRDATMAWSDAARLLLRVDVPCMVVPDACTELRLDAAAIAWNGSPPATRALHSALPLLQQAGHVLLIDGSGVEPASSARSLDAAVEIESYLRERCAEVTRVCLDTSAARAGADILALASDADMLVMGAYGRSRFGEWMFGGATRHILEHANLPVLLRS